MWPWTKAAGQFFVYVLVITADNWNGMSFLQGMSSKKCQYLLNSSLLQLLLLVLGSFTTFMVCRRPAKRIAFPTPFLNRFIHHLTWTSIMRNLTLRAAHLPGLKNKSANSLSWFKFQEFRILCPNTVKMYESARSHFTSFSAAFCPVMPVNIPVICAS